MSGKRFSFEIAWAVVDQIRHFFQILPPLSLGKVFA
jgi:hypothetical protein